MITEKTIETKVEISKSQNIRLIDVFVIAPFLFYVGYKAKAPIAPNVTGHHLNVLRNLPVCLI